MNTPDAFDSAHGQDEHDDGTLALAEGFARHIETWARASGADEASVSCARRAAMALSLATASGHVCLPLAGWAGSTAQPLSDGEPAASLRQLLLSSGVVGTPGAALGRPLLLDDEDRLYLHRHFDAERRLAQRLVQAARGTVPAVTAPAQQLLRSLFASDVPAGADPAEGVDWQQVAAALALRQRLLVISGGPGTGKTSVVVKLLACLLQQDEHTRIALAAPTGKAAARLAEAVRERAKLLPPALRARLPQQAFTVHRLLGSTPRGFERDAAPALAIDVLVVDEASMLDLSLATRLLEAVPAHARIVLLGDKDQLAAVEAGAVFAELSADPGLTPAAAHDVARLCGVPLPPASAAAARADAALPDSVVWFTRNYRFAGSSAIGRLAGDIRLGRSAAAMATLRGGGETLRWFDDAGPGLSADTLSCLQAGLARYLDAVQRDSADVAGIARAFDGFRVLCALRNGPRGVHAINALATQLALERLAPAGGIDPRSPWFIGRSVMVLRNDAVLKLFNGDVGFMLPAGDGRAMVHFPDGAGGFRALPPARLPAHDSAFAMTVHKAQGSEFDEVLVLLPTQRSRVLTRELLYTAVTRARGSLRISGAEAQLAEAIDTPMRRHSGLLARLREAAADDPALPVSGG